MSAQRVWKHRHFLARWYQLGGLYWWDGMTIDCAVDAQPLALGTRLDESACVGIARATTTEEKQPLGL